MQVAFPAIWVMPNRSRISALATPSASTNLLLPFRDMKPGGASMVLCEMLTLSALSGGSWALLPARRKRHRPPLRTLFRTSSDSPCQSRDRVVATVGPRPYAPTGGHGRGQQRRRRVGRRRRWGAVRLGKLCTAWRTWRAIPGLSTDGGLSWRVAGPIFHVGTAPGPAGIRLRGTSRVGARAFCWVTIWCGSPPMTAVNGGESATSSGNGVPAAVPGPRPTESSMWWRWATSSRTGGLKPSSTSRKTQADAWTLHRRGSKRLLTIPRGYYIIISRGRSGIPISAVRGAPSPG